MKQVTIREARKARKLTQDELAARSGVDQTTISDLETGRKANPRYLTIQRLASALGMSPARLRFVSRDDEVSV